MNKKKENLFEMVMEIPKISLTLFGIGFLVILYAFINLRNPFFVVVIIFIGIVFEFWGYDYWYKVYTQKKINENSYRIDSLVYPKEKQHNQGFTIK